LREIVTTKAFRKDIKRMRKRGKNIAKLEEVVALLCSDETLEQRYKAHPLAANWKPFGIYILNLIGRLFQPQIIRLPYGYN